MLKRITLLFSFLCFFLCPLLLCAQISVDKLSGAANISIPIHVLQRGRISVPISLQYTGGGVKVKEVEGTAGMGWNLSAGGFISRELRDLPDDMEAGSKGLLYNNNGTKLAAFTISNDNNPSTYTDEQADLNYISNLSSLSDTEPDIFYINLPGISCKLIFDANHQPRTIPYTDIKVSYTTDSWGIKKFTIKDDKGLEYEFEVSEVAFRTAKSSNPSAIQFHKDIYNKYQTKVAYRRKWYLTAIKDQVNMVVFQYDIPNNSNKYSTIPYAYYIGNSSVKSTQFTLEEIAPTYILSSINYDLDGLLLQKPFLKFSYVINNSTGMPIYNGFSGEGKSVSLVHDEVKSNGTNYTRFFLSNCEIRGTGTPLKLDFKYNGFSKNWSQYYSALPDSSSKQIDLWGYYDASSVNSLLPDAYINPSNPGLDKIRNYVSTGLVASYPYLLSGRSRQPNAAAALVATLSEMKDYNGKVTRVEYEPNTYYDPQAGANAYAGGFRVKQIKEFDEADSTQIRTTRYSYTDPLTGYSSGKALQLPTYAFLRPYTGSGSTEDKWKASVVRSEENLFSDGDCNILYSFVKEENPGLGSIQYRFSVPLSYFDAAVPPDWTATTVNVNSSAGSGYLLNDRNSYPFPPHLNFEIEQGLPLSTTTYNASNQKVKEVTYTYSQLGTPSYIYGLRNELNNGISTYARYANRVDLHKKISTVTSTDYDVINSTSQQQSEQFFYESSAHMELTKTEKINSDESKLINRIKYIKDYDLSVTNDSASLALKQLKDFNANFPVEQYTQVDRNGVTKTIAAGLTKFKRFNTSSGVGWTYVPWQIFSFRDAAGVSDFQVSSMLAGNFNEDNRYNLDQTFLSYTALNNPISVKTSSGQINTVIYNEINNLPRATIQNAAYKQFVLDDFEKDVDLDIFINPNLYKETQARSGLGKLALAANQEQSWTLNHKTGTAYYNFSVWIKAGTASSLEVKLSDGVSTATHYLPFTAGNWKYYKIKLPVSALGSSMQLKIKSGVAVDIDDVIFYPFDASVASVYYHPVTLNKLSETSNNGQANYYDYDVYNRLLHVYDNEHQILSKRTYVAKYDQENFNISIAPSYGLVGQAISFSAWPVPVHTEGVTYTWNFGDGSPSVTTQTPQVNHTYNAAGTYTTSVTVNSPIYGSKTNSSTATITAPAVKLISSGGMSIFVYHNGLLYDMYSESDLLYNNITLPSGTYTFEINSFDAYSNSNPYGFLSIKTITKAIGANSYVDNICQNSMPKVNSYSFTLNLTGLEEINFYLDYSSLCELTEL